MSRTSRNTDALTYDYGIEMTWHIPATLDQERIAAALGITPPEPEPLVLPPRPTLELNPAGAEMLSTLRTYLRNRGYSPRDADREARSLIRENTRNAIDRAERTLHVQLEDWEETCARLRYRATNAPRFNEERLFAHMTTHLSTAWLERGFPTDAGGWRVFRDCGAMEVNAPVFTTWEHFAHTYTHASTLATACGFETRRDGEFSSGGGHLHVNPRTHDKCFSADWRWYFAHDMAARPYLVWALLDPEDDNIRPASLSGNTDYDEDGAAYFYGNCYASHRQPSDAVTLELRFFEMPRSLDEQRLHVELVERWFTTIERNLANDRCPPSPVIWRNNAPVGWNVDRALTECARFARTIGLDSALRATFETVAERNITLRAAFTDEGVLR